jgi:hypothetical protein
MLPGMEPNRDFIARMAIEDRQGLLDYANDRPSWSTPDVHAAVVEVLDVRSRRPLNVQRSRKDWSSWQIPAKRAREFKRTLNPLLKKAWQDVEPWIITHDWVLDGKDLVTVEPNGGLDIKKTGHPEEMIILALWFVLRSPRMLVKKCQVCQRFFLDASRDQRGRFCRVSCRVKSFRGKA